jgi:hypothetical protein
MKRFAYLLILLLVSAQAGDALALTAAPISPSSSLADDNDEYLPAQRRPREEESISDHGPTFVTLNPPTANLPPAQRGVSFGWDLTAPFTPPSLYVFMSLQN